MSWCEKQIKSWEDFVLFVDRLKINEQGDLSWYFRGQSDASWKLIPSLLRQFINTAVTVERALGIEFGAFRRFQSQFHLYSKADTIDRSKWGCVAWWMVMQHYSCPTRLLDWSLSPYVALYFAIEHCPDRDGAVWLFPASALEILITQKHGKFDQQDESIWETNEIVSVLPVETVAHSERSAAQQGVFTVCTHILSNHGDVIAEAFCSQEDSHSLHKIVIPAEIKNDFLSRLRTMNITPGSLFPGLDGIGRAGRDYTRLRVWRTEMERKGR